MAYKGTRRVERGQLSTAQQKKVHVAPKRLGDGVKANHAERAVSIDSIDPRVDYGKSA